MAGICISFWAIDPFGSSGTPSLLNFSAWFFTNRSDKDDLYGVESLEVAEAYLPAWVQRNKGISEGIPYIMVSLVESVQGLF